MWLVLHSSRISIQIGAKRLLNFPSNMNLLYCMTSCRFILVDAAVVVWPKYAITLADTHSPTHT